MGGRQQAAAKQLCISRYLEDFRDLPYLEQFCRLRIWNLDEKQQKLQLSTALIGLLWASSSDASRKTVILQLHNTTRIKCFIFMEIWV